jgi:hypothetical protein
MAKPGDITARGGFDLPLSGAHLRLPTRVSVASGGRTHQKPLRKRSRIPGRRTARHWWPIGQIAAIPIRDGQTASISEGGSDVYGSLNGAPTSELQAVVASEPCSGRLVPPAAQAGSTGRIATIRTRRSSLHIPMADTNVDFGLSFRPAAKEGA